MFVTAISIRRDGYFGYGSKPDPTKPLNATIEVLGEHGKIELRLSPDMSRKVVELIAKEIAAMPQRTANAREASRMIRQYMRQWLACRRLNRMVAARRKAEADYMKRRQAAKVGWERRRAM